MNLPPPPAWECVEAILFDLDGTLIKASNRWPLQLAARLAPLKRIFPHLDTLRLGRALFGLLESPINYALSLLEHLHIDTGFWGLADRLRRSKGLAARGDKAWLEGSRDLVHILSTRYPLAVVTTRARKEAAAFVKEAGLADIFMVIITRQDVWRIKPHPEPVRKAAQRLGVPVQHCLMVGDTTMDMAAARRAGAWAVGVLSGLDERPELVRAGANIILPTATKLLDYLPLGQPGASSGSLVGNNSAPVEPALG